MGWGWRGGASTPTSSLLAGGACKPSMALARRLRTVLVCPNILICHVVVILNCRRVSLPSSRTAAVLASTAPANLLTSEVNNAVASCCSTRQVTMAAQLPLTSSRVSFCRSPRSAWWVRACWTEEEEDARLSATRLRSPTISPIWWVCRACSSCRPSRRLEGTPLVLERAFLGGEAGARTEGAEGEGVTQEGVTLEGGTLEGLALEEDDVMVGGRVANSSL